MADRKVNLPDDEPGDGGATPTEIAVSASLTGIVSESVLGATHAAGPDAIRADRRGYYLDRDGRRRLVAAGDVIPDGWKHADQPKHADGSSGGAEGKQVSAAPSNKSVARPADTKRSE